VVHLAHPSPERKWQLDRFGRLCRAYYSVIVGQSVGQNAFCLTRPILLRLDSFFGRLFFRPMLSVRCLSCLCCLPVCCVCDVGVLWPKVWTDQDETWHAGRPRPGHTVLDGDPSPPPLKGHRPPFSAHICCGQMAALINMPLGMELGLGLGDFVLD